MALRPARGIFPVVVGLGRPTPLASTRGVLPPRTQRVPASPLGTGFSLGLCAAAAAARSSKGRIWRRSGRPSGSFDAGGGLNAGTGAAVLMMLAMLYGANAPLLKSLEDLAPESMTSTELVSLRFVAAALPLLPALLMHSGRLGRLLSSGLELGFYLWAGYTLQMLGLEKVSASTATVLFALCGLMVQFLELAFDGKPLSKSTMTSSLGALVGLGLFVTAPVPSHPNSYWTILDQVWQSEVWSWLGISWHPPPAPHVALLHDVPGELLVLVGTFLFAVHVWRSAALVPASQATPDEDSGSHGLVLGALQLLVCAVLGVTLSLVDSSQPLTTQLATIANLDAGLWLRIFASGILCTGLPQTLELFALKVTPPAEAALIYCTIPVWGTALSVAMLKDPLSSQAILGGLLIVACSIPWSDEEEMLPALEPAAANEELVEKDLVQLVDPDLVEVVTPALLHWQSDSDERGELRSQAL